MSYLTASLISVCLILAFGLFLLFRDRRSLMDNVSSLRSFLCGFQRSNLESRLDVEALASVIYSDLGGVLNRLSESQRALELLLKLPMDSSPLTRNDRAGLLYHLHAVEQHMLRLAVTVPKSQISDHHNELLRSLLKSGGNDDLFMRAYLAAGVDWPTFAKPTTDFLTKYSAEKSPEPTPNVALAPN